MATNTSAHSVPIPLPARDLINLLCYLCALKLVNEPGLDVIMKCRRSRHPHAMKSLPESEHGVVIERPPHPGEFDLSTVHPSPCPARPVLPSVLLVV